MMETLRGALKEELTRMKAKSIKSLLVTRYERLMSYGKFKEVAEK
jgi:acetyl-CoA carboxylase carboxyl transferase subunit alpha